MESGPKMVNASIEDKLFGSMEEKTELQKRIRQIQNNLKPENFPKEKEQEVLALAEELEKIKESGADVEEMKNSLEDIQERIEGMKKIAEADPRIEEIDRNLDKAYDIIRRELVNIGIDPGSTTAEAQDVIWDFRSKRKEIEDLLSFESVPAELQKKYKEIDDFLWEIINGFHLGMKEFFDKKKEESSKDNKEKESYEKIVAESKNIDDLCNAVEIIYKDSDEAELIQNRIKKRWERWEGETDILSEENKGFLEVFLRAVPEEYGIRQKLVDLLQEKQKKQKEQEGKFPFQEFLDKVNGARDLKELSEIINDIVNLIYLKAPDNEKDKFIAYFNHATVNDLRKYLEDNPDVDKNNDPQVKLMVDDLSGSVREKVISLLGLVDKGPENEEMTLDERIEQVGNVDEFIQLIKDEFIISGDPNDPINKETEQIIQTIRELRKQIADDPTLKEEDIDSLGLLSFIPESRGMKKNLVELLKKEKLSPKTKESPEKEVSLDELKAKYEGKRFGTDENNWIEIRSIGQYPNRPGEFRIGIRYKDETGEGSHTKSLQELEEFIASRNYVELKPKAEKEQPESPEELTGQAEDALAKKRRENQAEIDATPFEEDTNDIKPETIFPEKAPEKNEEELEQIRQEIKFLEDKLPLLQLDLKELTDRYNEKKEANSSKLAYLRALFGTRSLGAADEEIQIAQKDMEIKAAEIRRVQDKINELRKREQQLLSASKAEQSNSTEASQPTPPAGETLRPEVIHSDTVEGKFFNQFGIKPEELEQLDGFKELSEGQQLLVLENLKQLTLGRIQEEAAEKQKQDVANASVVGKVWRNVSKKYQIAKFERNTAQEILRGGMAAHGEVLKQLVLGAKDGPQVAVNAEGGLDIHYVKMDNLTPEEQEKVNEFNQISAAYSKLPYEWSLGTASKKEQRQFQEAKDKYKASLENILSLRKAQNGGDNEEATLYTNDLERNIQLNQFLNTHPEVEKQLQSIQNDRIWTKALKNTLTERGIYGGAGFITRSATTSVLGLAGVPIAAAAMGGFMAGKRANETLRERERMARRGAVDSSKEAKDFADAGEGTGFIETIDFLVKEIEVTPDGSPKREEMLRSLQFQLYDAENKIENGTVNFGSQEERLFNQYELIRKISEGHALLNSPVLGSIAFKEKHEIDKAQYNADLDTILTFVEKQNVAVSDAQRKYIRNQVIKGATLGAGFAIAGYALRHFFSDGTLWGSKGSEQVPGGAKSSSVPVPPEVPKTPVGEEYPSSGSSPVERPRLDLSTGKGSASSVESSGPVGSDVSTEPTRAWREGAPAPEPASPEAARQFFRNPDDRSLGKIIEDVQLPNETSRTGAGIAGSAGETVRDMRSFAGGAENLRHIDLKVTQTGSSIESNVKKFLMDNQRLSAKEAGARAHVMALNFAKEHNLKEPFSLIHKNAEIHLSADGNKIESITGDKHIGWIEKGPRGGKKYVFASEHQREAVGMSGKNSGREVASAAERRGSASGVERPSAPRNNGANHHESPRVQRPARLNPEQPSRGHWESVEGRGKASQADSESQPLRIRPKGGQQETYEGKPVQRTPSGRRYVYETGGSDSKGHGAQEIADNAPAKNRVTGKNEGFQKERSSRGPQKPEVGRAGKERNVSAEDIRSQASGTKPGSLPRNFESVVNDKGQTAEKIAGNNHLEVNPVKLKTIDDRIIRDLSIDKSFTSEVTKIGEKITSIEQQITQLNEKILATKDNDLLHQLAEQKKSLEDNLRDLFTEREINLVKGIRKVIAKGDVKTWERLKDLPAGDLILEDDGQVSNLYHAILNANPSETASLKTQLNPLKGETLDKWIIRVVKITRSFAK